MSFETALLGLGRAGRGGLKGQDATCEEEDGEGLERRMKREVFERWDGVRLGEDEDPGEYGHRQQRTLFTKPIEVSKRIVHTLSRSTRLGFGHVPGQESQRDNLLVAQ